MTELNQFTLTERRRADAQSALDDAKTQAERNRMGQFATPFPLALEMLAHAHKLVPCGRKIRFLDPAFGTGAFYSALLQAFPASRIEGATGFEIDPHYGGPAKELWANTSLDIRLSDFTREVPHRPGYNLIICNPPYVRHHHIVNGEKTRIQVAARTACGVNLGGLSGLYCYFIGLSHAWMAEDGLAGWLIPSEFMDVNYGKEIKNYLLSKVRLLHIHRFDPLEVQFGDALVSSAIVWFRKERPPVDYDVEFSFGGTLSAPKVVRMVSARSLRSERKWTRFPVFKVRDKEDVPRLLDFFLIQRGLATGDNDFFILTPQRIAEYGLPQDFFRPILPSPRNLRVNEVPADEFGNPLIENPLFLLDCRLPEGSVRSDFPNLWKYFQKGKEKGVANRYLCKHRSPWYIQENRPAAPFFCTYLGRGNVRNGRPFRFILNQSRATATNVYLALYPKGHLGRALSEHPDLVRRVWEILNDISPNALLAEGRVYGGGLLKLEPRELANVPVRSLASLISELTESGNDYLPYRQRKIIAEV